MKMTVKITVQNDKWEILWQFQWQEYKSLSQMAIENDVDIPTSCGIWACYVCACKVKKWGEFIQIDKIQMPMIDVAKDENGKDTEVLSCVWWVKSDYLKSKEEYEIILQKQI